MGHLTSVAQFLSLKNDIKYGPPGAAGDSVGAELQAVALCPACGRAGHSAGPSRPCRQGLRSEQETQIGRLAGGARASHDPCGRAAGVCAPAGLPGGRELPVSSWNSEAWFRKVTGDGLEDGLRAGRWSFPVQPQQL